VEVDGVVRLLLMGKGKVVKIAGRYVAMPMEMGVAP
jgi:hypothetical protein